MFYGLLDTNTSKLFIYRRSAAPRQVPPGAPPAFGYAAANTVTTSALNYSLDMFIYICIVRQ